MECRSVATDSRTQNNFFCTVHAGLIESAEVRFESLKYETSEASNQQVCLLKTGSTYYSEFSVLINTHVAVAGVKTIIALPNMHDFCFADESDYTPLDKFQVKFQPGASKTCFTVNITNDLKVEEKESFMLSMQEPVGGLDSGISINTQYNGTVIKIVDNDCKCLYIANNGSIHHHYSLSSASQL